MSLYALNRGYKRENGDAEEAETKEGSRKELL